MSNPDIPGGIWLSKMVIVADTVKHPATRAVQAEVFLIAEKIMRFCPEANILYKFKGLDIGFGDEIVTFLLRYEHSITGKEAHSGFQLDVDFFHRCRSGEEGTDIESQAQLIAETMEKEIKNGPQKPGLN